MKLSLSIFWIYLGSRSWRRWGRKQIPSKIIVRFWGHWVKLLKIKLWGFILFLILLFDIFTYYVWYIIKFTKIHFHFFFIIFFFYFLVSSLCVSIFLFFYSVFSLNFRQSFIFLLPSLFFYFPFSSPTPSPPSFFSPTSDEELESSLSESESDSCYSLISLLSSYFYLLNVTFVIVWWATWF